MPSSPGGGIPQTGDKFYSENGTLLWNTDMVGEPNRVFVFSPKGNQNFNSIVKSFADKKDSSGLLHRMRQVSTEWSFIADANSDNVYASPQREFANTLLMILSIMGEGFAYGSRGVPIHSDYSVKNYWCDYYTTTIFQPWW